MVQSVIIEGIKNKSTYYHSSSRSEKLALYKSAMDVDNETTRIYALNLAKKNEIEFNLLNIKLQHLLYITIISL